MSTTHNIRINLRWIIWGVFVLVIARLLYREFGPLPGTSASKSAPARAYQATPESTATAMLRALDPSGSGYVPESLMNDRFNSSHLLLDQDLTSDEKQFLELFLDNQRAAAIYEVLNEDLTYAHLSRQPPTVTAASAQGDSGSAVLAVATAGSSAGEWTTANSYLDFRRLGANWFITELRTPTFPQGVYRRFKQAQ